MADLVTRDLDRLMYTHDRLRAATHSHVVEHGCNSGDGCTVRVPMAAAARELEHACSELARALERAERAAIEREHQERFEREQYERRLKKLQERFEATAAGREAAERFRKRAHEGDREQHERLRSELNGNSGPPALGVR
jgi:hypothetical protein